MGKRLVLLGMTVAALAGFVMPASASAIEMRDEGGKVAVDAAFTMTSTNALVTDTALGTIACADWLLPAKVTANGPDLVSGVGSTGPHPQTCFADSVQTTITKPVALTLLVGNQDKGLLSITFVVDVGPFECHFEGIGGTFTFSTGTGNDTIHIAGVPLQTQEICMGENPEGPVFEADFTLTTESNGQPIWFQ